MTTATNGATNGHTLGTPFTSPQFPVQQHADFPQLPNPAAPEPELPEFIQNIPTEAELTAARQLGQKAIAGQDAAELRQWKSWEAIESDREVAVAYQDAQRELDRERNEADIARQRKELAREITLTNQEHDDELDAAKARAQMRRLSNPVSYLAQQIRTQRWALTLVTAPAVFAVLLGAINVMYTLGQGVLGLGMTHPFFWALGGIELLATSPLVGIMLLHATSPQAGPKSWRDLKQVRFFGVALGLLSASVFYQVVPHFLLGQWVFGLLCLSIPAAIVVSMSMLPKAKGEFNERILNARTEAELSTRVGNLTPDQAKLIRQVRIVKQADANGQLAGLRDDYGLPSSTAARKALAAVQGRAGKPDAMAVVTALRVMEGVEQ